GAKSLGSGPPRGLRRQTAGTPHRISVAESAGTAPADALRQHWSRWKLKFFWGEKGMKHQHGFTLIELMIVVAIIAILAAIALPAYQDYVARSQVSEGFSRPTDARMAVVVYHADKANYPADNTQAGIATPASISGDYVESVTVGNGDGRIDILFGNEASAKISGQTLVMTMVPEGGSFHWRCSG